MKNLRLSLLLLFISYFLYGCSVSKEEKEARRENAFDLNGSYQTIAYSEVSLHFDITNENGKSDILVVLDRIGDLTEKEKRFLSELENGHDIVITPETLLNQLVLGKGRSFIDFTGGENISDNFGKTSKFNVCSDTVQSYNSNQRPSPGEENRRNLRLEIGYCFSGTVKEDSKEIIEGEFRLLAKTYYEIENDIGENGIGIENEGKVSLKYKAERESN